jgi:hypothetical protein
LKSDRRSFLKSAGSLGLLSGAGASSLAGAVPTDLAAPEGRSEELPSKVILLSIKTAQGESLGVKTPHGILDVRHASALLHMRAPLTLDAMLQGGDFRALAALIRKAEGTPAARAAYLDEAHIRYGRLFQNPGKIVCIGLNYREHAKEAGEPVPAIPILFNKYNNALAPHQCTIELPTHVSTKFDYEVELLVVIGGRPGMFRRPMPSTTWPATVLRTTSAPGTCSSNSTDTSGCSARPWTGSGRSDPISCRPTSWAIRASSTLSAGSMVRPASIRTRRT